MHKIHLLISRYIALAKLASITWLTFTAEYFQPRENMCPIQNLAHEFSSQNTINTIWPTLLDMRAKHSMTLTSFNPPVLMSIKNSVISNLSTVLASRTRFPWSKTICRMTLLLIWHWTWELLKKHLKIINPRRRRSKKLVPWGRRDEIEAIDRKEQSKKERKNKTEAQRRRE